ncbi:MAG: nicotinate-nucleotide--dimethylbenzimidazole phosphoribosyltransferase [Candidatus Manganitrophaceae bacterium]
MTLLEETLQEIQPVDPRQREQIQQRLDRLTKPPGSLGRLEELAVWYGAARGEIKPTLRKKGVVVFAADHGVTEEGVSAYPKEVTAQMVYNFLRGGGAINALARHTGAEVTVVDIGVAHDFEVKGLPGLRNAKIRPGTANMALRPAMLASEARAAIEVGLVMAEEMARSGVDLIATGEMGIGNTAASSAITSLITGHPVSTVTGRGTGLDEPRRMRKVAVIERAIARNFPDRRDPESPLCASVPLCLSFPQNDPLNVLAKVGGLEIAGLVGLILGGARRRIPVVLDGFIAGAAALVAVSLKPPVRDYLLASHRSAEPGHGSALAWLQLIPVLDLNLRLGEGTGAVLGMGLVEAGVKILSEMATFEEAGVSERESG